uniref:VP91 n=1 Tax=Spodoptera frugiperda nuclear polyhedrosis virus TaxID=10455 RepID=A0A7G3W7D5_NPVSF|nr:VP91 [Spodoptera frugiperda multiple nucleopolyhedrovirus]
MSMVPLLLVAIILILLFSIFYLIIYSEYNEQDFDNKLRVVTEYAKRTNAEHPLPDYIQYVSEVDSNFYVVRTIDTTDLREINNEVHDDRLQTFNFIEQNFEPTPPPEKRVRKNSDDRTKYELRGDDGWMEVECPSDERFDETTNRCVPIPPCDGKTSGMYPLTERLIDSLILNHRVSRANISQDEFHPTMYLRCFEGGSHVVEECPNNHLFNGVECELRNDCVNRSDGFILNVFPEDLNINEYMICENGESKVVSCPFGKIFDRRLLTCVDAEPCAVHGADYTYITDDIGPTQFYRCVSENQVELVTCINRVFVNDNYECSGDPQCSMFENGTGQQIRNYDDNTFRYDYGLLICDNYNIVEDITCNNENLIDVDKLYNNKFYTDIMVPAEIFNRDTRQCVPSTATRPSPRVLSYVIENVANDYNINFITSILGDSLKVRELIGSDTLANKVLYARNFNVLGFDASTSDTIDCFGDYLFDPLAATELNVCKDNELVENIKLTPDQYIAPVTMEIRSDADYQHWCLKSLVSTENLVEFDYFTTQIMANILQSDVCGEILTKIHDKYTTIPIKYTTIPLKYNYESVKGPKYIERYRANIPFEADETDTSAEMVPMFDLFERYDVIEPLFDPWSTRDIIDVHPDDVGGGSGGGGGTRPPVEPEPEPEPEPPSLTLTDKELNYTCFYAIPTFKLSACNVVDDHIKESIRNLRENIKVDAECESAAGLANIINAYAYLGNGLGCKSTFDGDTIRVQVSGGKTFLNVETQSDDGVQYNKWIFNNNGKIMACPDHAIADDFTCNLEDDRIYYIEDLQY